LVKSLLNHLNSRVFPFTYEPAAPELFAMLLPIYIEIQIYRALLESQAAEEAARMTAMDNATKNCDD